MKGQCQMSISVIKSSAVCGNNYLIGLSWGSGQLRIGFVFFHVVILTER